MKMGTSSHPKLLRLKASLSIPTYIAVGILESLWMAAAQWKDHGGVGEWTNQEIAAVIGWEGSPSTLIDALIDARWLDRDVKFRLIIHDWRDHAPHYLQERWRKRGGFPSNSATFPEIPGTVSRNGELSAPYHALPCQGGGGGGGGEVNSSFPEIPGNMKSDGAEIEKILFEVGVYPDISQKFVAMGGTLEEAKALISDVINRKGVKSRGAVIAKIIQGKWK